MAQDEYVTLMASLPALGPILADAMFPPGIEITVAMVQRMFLAAGAAAVVSLILTALATAGSRPIKQKPRPPMLWLLKRYHPGAILLCAGAMGIGVMLPSTFLQPYAEQLDIHRVRTFFFSLSQF